MTLQQLFDKNKAYIIGEYSNGKSTNKLAEEFNCNAGSIYLALQRWNVVIKKRAKFKGNVEQFDNKIIEMHKLGLSANKISKELGISDATVLDRGKKLGLSFSDKNTWKNPIRLKDRKQEVINLYKQGLSCCKIAKKLNYAQSQISQLLNKEGFVLTKNRYNVDLDFFKNINSYSKSYLLGLWYADGNVQEDKIRLQVADLELIKYSKKQFSYSGPIKIIPPKKEGRKTQYLINIARQQIVKDAIDKGCYISKSLILKFPSEEQVPINLLNHFILGWFDGDGNIYYYEKKNKWKIQLVGTQDFLEGIINTVGVTGYWSQRHKKRKRNNWNFTIGKTDQIIKFLEFIYKDSEFCLQRKKALAHECLADLRLR